MHRERNIVPAGRFKAQCLALIDQVARSGETLVITKRGKPVARLVPIDQRKPLSLRGSVRFHGDIVASIGEPWDADS